MITAASIATVAVVASVTFWVTHQQTEEDRWSAFPQTVSCTVDRTAEQPSVPGEVIAPLPDSVQVQQITLTHPGGQQVEVAVSFARGAPPDTVNLPHPILGGEVPVTPEYSLDLIDFSRGAGAPKEFVGASNVGDGHWHGDKPGEAVSAQSTSNGFTVVIDASVQQDKIGNTPWRPSVMFNVAGASPPNSLYPANESWSFDPQWCFWTKRPAGFDNSSSPPTAQPQTPSAQPAPLPTTGPTPNNTSPLLPPDTPGADSFVFQSPSGNIACRVGPSQGQGYALCDVGEHDFPPTCPQGSEIRLALQQGDGPRFEGCNTDGLVNGQHEGLLYGSSWRSGAITCASAEDGITCTDSTTDHYFKLSRQSYQVG